MNWESPTQSDSGIVRLQNAGTLPAHPDPAVAPGDDGAAVGRSRGRATRLLDAEPDCPLRAVLKRVLGWQIPPNWSGAAWHQEMEAVALCELYQARLEFEPARGVPLGGFLYSRCVARAYTRYRQEWAYSIHNTREPADADFDPQWEQGRAASSRMPLSPDGGDLGSGLAALSATDRAIIERIFWQGCTECALARELNISQPAVNKRKRQALARLRTLFGPAEE